jgi:hypothetical protein
LLIVFGLQRHKQPGLKTRRLWHGKALYQYLLVVNRIPKFPIPHIPEELQRCMKIENRSRHRLTIKKIKNVSTKCPGKENGAAAGSPKPGATAWNAVKVISIATAQSPRICQPRYDRRHFRIDHELFAGQRKDASC